MDPEQGDSTTKPSFRVQGHCTQRAARVHEGLRYRQRYGGSDTQCLQHRGTWALAVTAGSSVWLAQSPQCRGWRSRGLRATPSQAQTGARLISADQAIATLQAYVRAKPAIKLQPPYSLLLPGLLVAWKVVQQRFRTHTPILRLICIGEATGEPACRDG